MVRKLKLFQFGNGYWKINKTIINSTIPTIFIVHSLIKENNKFLILKRVPHTYLGRLWDLPGGTLEDNEDPVAGAKREAKEEANIDITNYSSDRYDEIKKTKFTTLIFLAEPSIPNQLITINPEEHTEFKWVTEEELNLFETAFYLKPCLQALRG